jgi:hypothetical protein
VLEIIWRCGDAGGPIVKKHCATVGYVAPFNTRVPAPSVLNRVDEVGKCGGGASSSSSSISSSSSSSSNIGNKSSA